MRILAATLLAALVAAPAALGASFTFTVNTTSPVTAPGVTLNGDDQTTTFTMSYTVAYTGGNNNAGWHVSASSTALTSGSATLPAMQVTTVAEACGGSCTTAPNNSVTWPVTLGTTAQEIYNAATTTGRGTFSLTPTFQVSYPANAQPGTYSATVTVTGATGP
ncbi:MAG TPA: hypothetical protein VFA05_07075 [Gaiellaceae bacterium]|nr:hypothetical protein [Gaiellaceae bacterium]